MNSKSGASVQKKATRPPPQKRQKAGVKAGTKPPQPSAATVPDATKRRGRQATKRPLPHSELPAANNSDAGRLSIAKIGTRRQQETKSPADESGARATAHTPGAAPQRRTRSADKSQAKPSPITRRGPPEQQVGDKPPADLEKVCQTLSEWQKIRMFCIISQSRIDRSMQSAIARAIGYDPKADEADRKAVFKRAGAIMKAVEAEEPFDRLPIGDPRSEMLWAYLPLIPLSAHSRKIWDKKLEETVLEMRKLAQTLPVFGWVKEHAKGVGDLGLARIVGEAPLLGSVNPETGKPVYYTHEKLWKRMGLAVIAGERQQKKSDKDEAFLHGYAPRRRAEAWSVCSDTMFRQQWRGKNPDDPDTGGYPIGPYGAVYAARKAYTLPRIAETEDLPFSDRRKWTKKRCEWDARRVMTKEFLRDLWRVWHGLEARHPARFAVAKAA